MREAVIVGLIIGTFFAGVGAVVAALAIKNATPSILWDIILWSGVAATLCSAATMALVLSADYSHGRPLLIPAAVINLGICLIVSGLVWHFSETTSPNRALTARNLPQQPSLVTAFMTDFHMKFTGMMANWDTDLLFPPANTRPKSI